MSRDCYNRKLPKFFAPISAQSSGFVPTRKRFCGSIRHSILRRFPTQVSSGLFCAGNLQSFLIVSVCLLRLYGSTADQWEALIDLRIFDQVWGGFESGHNKGPKWLLERTHGVGTDKTCLCPLNPPAALPRPHSTYGPSFGATRPYQLVAPIPISRGIRVPGPDGI